MHMGNELVTPLVGGAFIAAAGGILAYAAWKGKSDAAGARVPLMGVLGAFVFAAQMVNFPIMAGTSGHLGGGMLLAVVLGPHIASLVIASVLIVQCLIFQDGGILALGMNIINMGIVPAYAGYSLYRMLAAVLKSDAAKRAALWLCSMLAVAAGAALVPIEAKLAGSYEFNFMTFLGAMAGVHLLIGAVEGLITVAVVSYINEVRPDVVGWRSEKKAALSPLAAAASILALALVIGGFVSNYASQSPDGLEKIAGDSLKEKSVSDGSKRADELQAKVALFPDYNCNVKGAAGAAGTLATLALVFVISLFYRSRKE